MPTVNRRGAYIYPVHDRLADWDFLKRWQPSVITLMLDGSWGDPASVDVSRIVRYANELPGTLLILRVWDVDDHHGERKEQMAADPTGFAETYHDWWRRLFERIPAGIRNRCVATAINEPQPHHFKALKPFTQNLMALGAKDGIRYGVLRFSVGNPAKPSENHPHGWQYFADLEDAIVAGDHVVILHEYFQKEGIRGVWMDGAGAARHDYGNLWARHKVCPYKRAKIVIGEWGIDGILFDRDRHPEYGHNGWLGFRDLWGPERYADEYKDCCQDAAPNVIGLCPFVSDFGDRTWASFDLMPAYGALLSRKHLCEVEVSESKAYLPHVGTPPQPAPVPQVGGDNWQRVWPITLDIEGGLSLDPNDPGNWYNGKLVGTKYGISAAVWGGRYDIPNLTEEQALEIYRVHYWLKSGANRLPWPLCLVHFDSFVQNEAAATKFLHVSQGNVWLYLAERNDWYTKANNWEHFGRGWHRRISRLMRHCLEA